MLSKFDKPLHSHSNSILAAAHRMPYSARRIGKRNLSLAAIEANTLKLTESEFLKSAYDSAQITKPDVYKEKLKKSKRSDDYLIQSLASQFRKVTHIPKDPRPKHVLRKYQLLQHASVKPKEARGHLLIVSKQFATPFLQTKYELLHRFDKHISNPKAFVMNTVQPCNIKPIEKSRVQTKSNWNASPNLKHSYELMLKLDPVSVMNNEVEEFKISGRSQ